MIPESFKTAYATGLAEGRGPEVWERLAEAATGARRGDRDALLFLNLALARVAFATPEAIMAVYDSWTHAFLGKPLGANERSVAEKLLAKHAAPPDTLWDPFWAIIDGPSDAMLTARVAALGAHTDTAMKRACVRAQGTFPGQAQLSAQMPPRLTLEDLQGHPVGSLGQRFHSLIVDNGFDLDVLDPASVIGFQPELDLTNIHILQQHEIWHLVAGYSTSSLHEVAISAFQLAQFGHHYSAMFLAVSTLKVALEYPAYAAVAVLQVIAEGWLHGRSTLPMMNIDWRTELGSDLAAIRAKYGIAAFQSVIPDLR